LQKEKIFLAGEKARVLDGKRGDTFILGGEGACVRAARAFNAAQKKGTNCDAKEGRSGVMWWGKLSTRYRCEGRLLRMLAKRGKRGGAEEERYKREVLI